MVTLAMSTIRARGIFESFEKAKAAYQEAIQLKSDFVLPHYRLYSKI